MLGIQVTKDQINAAAGNIALELKRKYDDAVSFNAFLLRTQNSDLISLGFTQPEVDIIKSAYADLAYGKINSFDSSTFIKQLYGTGI